MDFTWPSFWFPVHSQVVRQLCSQTQQFRILALSATPGGDSKVCRPPDAQMSVCLIISVTLSKSARSSVLYLLLLLLMYIYSTLLLNNAHLFYTFLRLVIIYIYCTILNNVHLFDTISPS